MNAGLGRVAVIAIFLTKLNYWHTQKNIESINNIIDNQVNNFVKTLADSIYQKNNPLLKLSEEGLK